LGKVAATVKLPNPPPAPRESAFSLVIMLDGWMARECGPDWGAGRRRRNAKRIVWHEIKSAVIYRLEQRGQSAGGRGPVDREVLRGHSTRASFPFITVRQSRHQPRRFEARTCLSSALEASRQ